MTVLHCFSMGVVALLAVSAGAAKRDGVWLQPVVSSDVSFSPEQYWVDGKTVADGGRVTFLNQSADSKKVITVDKADQATWGGASFGSGCFILRGQALTLTGDGVLEVATGGAPKLENDVTLASGSRMTKRGGGSLTFGGVVSGGTLVLEDGALVVTNPVLPTCALELAAGRFTWSPSAAADAALEGTVPSLVFGPDRVRFKVTRGNAASSAVTFDSLASSAEGGFLELIGSGPVSGFGTTERFLVKDRPSDAGYIDASVVSRGAANADDALSFLVYDEEKGFVAAPEADFVAGQTADGKVAVIRADTTISQDASVSALRIENGATVTIASGVTLTVGDGVHPAGVIFRESKATRGTQRNFHGPGTLAFKSGAPGFLYFNLSCVNGNSNWTDPVRLYFKDNIRFTGDRGITFAGVAGDLRDYGSFAWSAAQVGWTGGTSVLGVRLQGVLDTLPAPLRILGESSQGFGGQIRQNNSVWPAQVLTLSGTGSSSAGHGGVFSSGGSPSVRFTGKVTLANDVTFSADNKCAADKGTQSFYGGLTGPGGIFIGNNASIDLGGPCDYAGKTEFVGFGSWYIVHGPNGTPGTGPIVNTTQLNAPIRFIGHDGLVTSNDITTVGLLSVESSTNVTFLGRVSAAKGSLCDGAVIGCGTNAVNFGAFDSDGSVAFVAGADGGVAQLGISGTDLKVGAVFRDGDGGRRLGIDKVASDVVTLYGASSNSGAVVVREGTLRLSQDVFTSPDISYWLDASDASTVETDGSGRVTKWTSKRGVAGVAFVPPPAAADLPYCGPTVSEGMVNFTLADYTRLVATNVQTATALPNLTQRTVFVVTRPRTASLSAKVPNYGLFGWWNKDVGQRWGASGWNVNGYTEGTAATFDTCRGLRLDGQRRGQGSAASGSLPLYSYRNDELQIVTMRHELDYDVSTEWGVIKTRALFPPALGGYFPGPEASSYSRGYNGEIAEVIAFRRLLNEAEMRMVETYLSEKWGIALSHGSETAELQPVLGGEAPLEVCAGAVLDLNGVDVTVSSLAGSGLITNSAATASKLVVSGANSFRGVIGGAVTLVTQGEDAGSGYLLRDGAGLAVDGGTSVAGTFADGLGVVKK